MFKEENSNKYIASPPPPADFENQPAQPYDYNYVPPPPREVQVSNNQSVTQTFVPQQTPSHRKAEVKSSKDLNHSYLLNREKVPFGQSIEAVEKWAKGHISDGDISVLYTALHNFKVKEYQLREERFRIVSEFEEAKEFEFEEYSKLKEKCKFTYDNKKIRNQKVKKLEKTFKNQLKMLQEKRNEELKSLNVAYEQNDLNN
jgi:hypothetical protein